MKAYPQYRIKINDLYLTIDLKQNNFNNLANGGSHVPIRLGKLDKNHWGQIWEVVNHTHIKNPRTQFHLHHGNQSPAPFACLVRPSDERHQMWDLSGNSIKSNLDNKVLYVKSFNIGALVELRNSEKNQFEFFEFIPIKPKFRIIERRSRLAIEIHNKDNKIESGSNSYLKLEIPRDTPYQLWKYDPYNMKFINPKSKMCLHHGNQNHANAFPCVVSPSLEPHQQWNLFDGKIISALDGKILSVDKPNHGAKLYMRHVVLNNAIATTWLLERVDNKYS